MIKISAPKGIPQSSSLNLETMGDIGAPVGAFWKVFSHFREKGSGN